MNGILVVDKPAGFTSFDVVAKLRGICGTRKIGHGGTLDPMATGVLPVFIGRAVKAVDMQPRQDKTYEAEILFGVATDTGDITGTVLRSERQGVSEEQLRDMLQRVTGKQEQLPPLYSAVKVNGKPLYRYAREGKEVERKTRQVEIFSAEYLGPGGENRFCVTVHCSKGTYIRTLAEKIGEKLGVPATLSALRRTGAGVFDISSAYTLEEIQEAKDKGALESLVQKVDVVFAGLPRMELDENAARRLANGAAVYGTKKAPGRYAAYRDGIFLGIAAMRKDGTLGVEKWFAE